MARYEDYAGNEVPIEQARVVRDDIPSGVHRLSIQSVDALLRAKDRYEQQLARHIKPVS